MTNNEDTRQKLKELIAKTDKEVKSPEERASMILEFIKYEWPDLTDWDLTCFASQWLAAMAIGPMPWLLNNSKAISNMLYKQHYLMGGREEHDVVRKNAPNENKD